MTATAVEAWDEQWATPEGRANWLAPPPAGVAIFMALFGSRLDRSQAAIRRLGQAAALAAVAVVAGHYALEAARMAGGMSGIWDPTLQEMVWHSPSRSA